MKNFKETAAVDTSYATIHMAGDINHARRVIAKFCDIGACVQLQPCDYIYTRGSEAGFTARFMNYGRFPRTPGEIYEQALLLADTLGEELSQKSFSIETESTTVYFTHSDLRFQKG